jgi:nickel transport protein
VRTPTAFAHGVRHSVSEGATVVAATYDDGSPMAFCDVTVLAPQNGEAPYQEGTSDRNGCFAFLPDTNGTWTVTIDDGMGHLEEARIEIDSIGGPKTETAHAPDRLGGAVVGISIIFGIFGVYALLTRRRPH